VITFVFIDLFVSKSWLHCSIEVRRSLKGLEIWIRKVTWIIKILRKTQCYSITKTKRRIRISWRSCKIRIIIAWCWGSEEKRSRKNCWGSSCSTCCTDFSWLSCLAWSALTCTGSIAFIIICTCISIQGIYWFFSSGWRNESYLDSNCNYWITCGSRTS